MDFNVILMAVQMFFAVVIGLYFWNQLRSQKGIDSRWTGNRARKWKNYASFGPSRSPSRLRSEPVQPR